MDFPIFHLDIFGNRGLVATIAILHVLVNHSLAVGMMPLVACMEWYGHKRQDPRWDKLAYNILFVAFLITTTVGAMTGIGIWLSVFCQSLFDRQSDPRVFLGLVHRMAGLRHRSLPDPRLYAHMEEMERGQGEGTPRQARLHAGFFSWVTMALIVAILGFMMDPGNWMSEHTLWAGITNPIYLPQLAFRTPLAAAMAGIVAMFLAQFFTRGDAAFRNEALRAIALWTLFFAPFVLIAGFWYYSVVPDVMKENFGVAIATLQFTDWQQKFLEIALVTVVVILIAVQVAIARPNLLPRVAMLAPLVAVIWMIGHFERVREFVRKPYVIGRYMYANGFRVDDYPLLQRDGILAYATYSNPLTDAERAGLPQGLDDDAREAKLARLQKGKDVFMITCSRCHTGHGVNSITGHLQRMFGDQPWTADLTTGYIEGMHQVRSFMPPFPGDKEELGLLGEYLEHLQNNLAPIPGAQTAGIIVQAAPALRAAGIDQSEAIAR